MRLNDFFSAPDNSPGTLLIRLRRLLRLWRDGAPAGEHREDTSSRELPKEARTAWHAFLEQAHPVPPSSHVEGLLCAIKLHHSTMPSASVSIEDLSKSGALLIEGSRVVFCSPLPPGSPRIERHGWAMVVSHSAILDRPGLQLAVSLLEGNLHDFEDGLLVSFSGHGRREDLLFLAAQSENCSTGPELYRLWGCANALGSNDDLLIDFLPARKRSLLARHMADILLANKDQLDAETDFRLGSFARFGSWSQITPRHPSCRLTKMLAAFRALDLGRIALAEQFYSSIVGAFIGIGEPALVGEVLSQLPAGDVLLWALFIIGGSRPELLADFIASHRCVPEAVVGLHMLRDTVHQPDGTQYELTDEWLEVQHCWRKFVLSTPLQDITTLLAIGLEDERMSVPHRRRLATVDKLPPESWFAGWPSFLEDPRKATTLTQRLCEVLAASSEPDLADLTFSLRISAALFTLGHASLARSLAERIVDGYFKAIHGSSWPRSTFDLSGHGALLMAFTLVLRSGERGHWERWLRPFELEKWLRLADGSEDARERSRIPEAILVHVDNLVALLEVAAPDEYEEILDETLRIYAAEKQQKLLLPLFSWTAAVRSSSDEKPPLLVKLGAGLSRASEESAQEAFARILEAKPSALEWAQLLRGLGTHHLLSQQIRLRITKRLKDELTSDDPMRLGTARALTLALALTGDHVSMELCAQEIIQITRSWDIRNEFATEGYRLLKLSLIRQARFEEALGLRSQEAGRSPLAPNASELRNG